ASLVSGRAGLDLAAGHARAGGRGHYPAADLPEGRPRTALRAAALGGLLDRSGRLLLRGALGIVTAHPHSIPVVESASAPGIAWKWLLTPWRLPNGLETPSTNRLPFAGLVQMAQWLRVIIGLYERGHPHPVGHRARRPAGRQAAAAAGPR